MGESRDVTTSLSLRQDEFGDVLWDDLNALSALEPKAGISDQSALVRACQKFEERMSGVRIEELWKDMRK